MGRYYCDYCDVFLTHDSFNCRRAHMRGRKHKQAVRDYYAKFIHGGVNPLSAIVSSQPPFRPQVPPQLPPKLPPQMPFQMAPPMPPQMPPQMPPRMPPPMQGGPALQPAFFANGVPNPALIERFRKFQEQQRLAANRAAQGQPKPVQMPSNYNRK